MKAVIFAAGLGTRLKPFTNNKPKALVKIDERPLLELAITYLKNNGFREFIINVHHFADQIIDFLKSKNNFDVDIIISDEREKLLDTGGGLVKMAKYLRDDDFLVYNVDILTNINLQTLVEYHKKSNALATIPVRDRQTNRYFLFDENMKMCGWTNVKTGEVKQTFDSTSEMKKLAFSCMHVINPRIFEYKPDDDVFSIIPWYLELSKNHLISGYQHDDDFWLDVGKISTLDEAKRTIGNLKFL